MPVNVVSMQGPVDLSLTGSNFYTHASEGAAADKETAGAPRYKN